MSDHICMEMTLAEAAEKLGISRRHAQRLARSGRLQIVREVGRSIIVDDSGVTARQQGQGGRGRRWNVDTAWAVIELLQDGTTDRVSGSSLSRLKGRLRDLDVDDLVRLASLRATTHRFTQTRRTRDELTEALLLTGVSSLADSTTAEQFGLVANAGSAREGYVTDGRWEALRDRFGLVADAEGEVVVHVTPAAPVEGPVTTALDLVERGTVRERAAGAAVLARALGR